MRTSLALAAFLMFAACASEPPPDTSPSGPSRVLPDAIAAHAREFDENIPLRTPGSDEELQASVYILGHLQDAGYVPLLDSVPVADLVEATNLVALPTTGGEPEHLVAVSYGNSESATGGEGIGVFLEVARALHAARPDHDVAFVALAAEASPRLGGRLGTRRLIQYLQDEDFSPHVITIDVGSQRAVTVSGSRAEDFEGAVVAEPRAGDPLFLRARLEHTVVSGPAPKVGEVLLDHLDD